MTEELPPLVRELTKQAADMIRQINERLGEMAHGGGVPGMGLIQGSSVAKSKSGDVSVGIVVFAGLTPTVDEFVNKVRFHCTPENAEVRYLPDDPE